MNSRFRIALGCIAVAVLGASLAFLAIGYLTNRPPTFDVSRHVGSFVGGFVGVFGLMCLTAGIAGLISLIRSRS